MGRGSGSVQSGNEKFENMAVVFKHLKGCHVEDKAELFSVVIEQRKFKLHENRFWLDGFGYNFPNCMSCSTLSKLPWEIVGCSSVIGLNRNWIANCQEC